MELTEEVPVFTQTNMGTHLIVPVSPEITTIHFKRELERAHIGCFRELGKVTCLSAMVKQESNFYLMPDSLPLKYGFNSSEKVWFVHVNVSPLEICSAQGNNDPIRKASRLPVNHHMKLKKNNAKAKYKKARKGGLQFARFVIHGFVLSNYLTSKRTRKRRNIRQRADKGDNMGVEAEYANVVADNHVPDSCKCEQNDPDEVVEPNNSIETPCESLSGVASVSVIIDKYFSGLVELDQVDSSPFNPRDEKNRPRKLEDAENNSPRIPTNKLLPSPLPHVSHSSGYGNKYERSQVGERLVIASNSLQKTQSNLSKAKKLFEAVAGSTASTLVFEIDDDNDM